MALSIEDKNEIAQMINDAVSNHRHTGTDSLRIDGGAFDLAPFANIADPSGVATDEDVEARAAINSILDILEKTKLMSDQ